MGSGKTSIGKIVAKKVNYTFLDTDTMIEQDQGCTIEDIFFYAGEDFFRKLETLTLNNLLKKKRIVLATGGGIIKTEGNLDILKQIGKVYFLNNDPDIMFQRAVQSDKRPLLKNSNNKVEDYMKIYNERLQFYMQADTVLKNDTQDKSKMVTLLLDDFYTARINESI